MGLLLRGWDTLIVVFSRFTSVDAFFALSAEGDSNFFNVLSAKIPICIDTSIMCTKLKP